MKNTFTFLLLLAVINSFAGNADSTKHNNKFNYQANGGIEGFFRINYNKLNFDNLNKVLNNSIFVAPVTPTLSVGGGGIILVGHLILGGEGQTLITQSTEYPVVISGVTHSQKNTYGGGYGLFNIGVAVVTREHLLIYPQLGIGGGHVYALTTQSPTDNTFQYNVSNPGIYQKMVNNSFMLNPKLCIDILIANSYLLGLNIGYNYMTTDKWKINGNSVSNGPKSNINGVYAGFSIGIGGVSSYNSKHKSPPNKI